MGPYLNLDKANKNYNEVKIFYYEIRREVITSKIISMIKTLFAMFLISLFMYIFPTTVDYVLLFFNNLT